MERLTREQLLGALETVGIGAGDGVLVHAALQYLGRAEGGAAMVGESLLEALGPDGTLAAPAFNFAFARGEAYDPVVTPSAGMGALAEWLRQHPGARRTPHPLQSLSVVGRWAQDLAGRDTPSAFDPGSSFEHLLDLDFKLLLLGADIQAVSMLHYSEQRLNVPYRYWKTFTGRYRGPAGWEERSYRMFVRDMKIDPHIELYPVQHLLAERGQWHETPLNYGKVSSCRLADFVAAVEEFLRRDAWSLIPK